ncbi:MAG TPA: peptidase U32 family protein [Candidatus Deferrimicrobium sp.]|nr:peptidase U32 family protein [Candidatus Deferrimicrobium sp.]
MQKVELLAPAKNFKVIKAALSYADSFYFGVQTFNMRMQADNFTTEDLPKVTKFLHDAGQKANLATNIVIYENELTDLKNLLIKAQEAEIDAVIVHDLASIQFAKEIDLPFHVSTQCNVSNSMAAQFYETLGAQRIILARELSLAQIKEIKAKLSKSLIECFVHGAMCTSISGRCYFSQDICGTAEKSANRGECIQPCRRQWWVYDETGKEYIYDGARFLNSRDLCMVSHIPELIEAKIDCFKIEGRMRDPYYVETVSRTYREAIEAHYNGSFSNNKVKLWIKDLKKVYNRGFTTGFYFGRPTEKDHQHKSPSNLSHFRMIQLGTIEKYSSDSHIAKILLTNGKLRVGEEIIVMGPKKSDTYFHQTLQSIVMAGKQIEITPPAFSNNPLTIDLEMRETTKLGDKLYIFTDETYRHRRLKRRTRKKSDYYRLT